MIILVELEKLVASSYKSCGAERLSIRSSLGIVAWINFTSVIPWLDHGIQLKILKY
ncbi:MAG TPA: hypothetical protein LFV92_04960 [Rickettsia endosymbiont of Ceroptres masudai]|nr:hypothetical protein [Rickettsia endosymbiont of Ceroptres masudai]